MAAKGAVQWLDAIFTWMENKDDLTEDQALVLRMDEVKGEDVIDMVNDTTTTTTYYYYHYHYYYYYYYYYYYLVPSTPQS